MPPAAWNLPGAICRQAAASLVRGWQSVESFEQDGELSAFGRGQRGQETLLLFVEYAYGVDLGGAAGAGGMNEERPPVAGMALTCHVSLVLQVVEQGHHGGPVDPE